MTTATTPTELRTPFAYDENLPIYQVTVNQPLDDNTAEFLGTESITDMWSDNDPDVYFLTLTDDEVTELENEDWVWGITAHS